MDRAQAQCAQCGQTDDHPKVHAEPVGIFHHDCLPFGLRQQVIDTSPLGEMVIEAAESGVHGSELVDHILSLHEGN